MRGLTSPRPVATLGRRENMVRVNMVFHDAICECFEGAMLESCLLKSCFHVRTLRLDQAADHPCAPTGQSADRESADRESADEDSPSLNSIYGKFPTDLGTPPLRIKNMLESKPLKSGLLVCGLTVQGTHFFAARLLLVLGSLVPAVPEQLQRRTQCASALARTLLTLWCQWSENKQL